MNQILSTENNYKQKKPKMNNTLDMRKIMIIFSALIIIFALVIVGAKVVGMIKEKNEKQDDETAILNKPQINIKQDGTIYTLEVTYDEGLEQVKYWWNDETVIERNLHGSTTPVKIQDQIPEGDYNVLHVIATGVDGSTNEVEQEFVKESDTEDPNKPSINWYYSETSAEIEIIARSEKGIDSLKYRWNEEEEITVNHTSEGQKEIRVVIDAKRGVNDIYITATDIEGNVQTKEESINGIRSPDINVELVNRNTISISISHDMGFKKIIININGQELVYDETNPQYSIETTTLNTSAEMPPGSVHVKIQVYTLEQEDKEYVYEGMAEIPE